MPAIHIRNVPESTLSALRERADAHRRSMQQELLAVLESVAAEPVPQQVPSPIQLFTVEVGGSGSWRREDIYGEQGR
jgi:plasmid stability protein